MELGACHECASGSNLAFRVDFCSQIHRVRIFCGGQEIKIFDMRLHRTAVLTILLHLATALPALAEQRMVSVGERRIAVYCDGEMARFPTVILVPAGGRTAKDWDTVQPEVARFTRVCSYDHANFGQSDRAPVRLQTVDEVVDDLHAWLQASREKDHSCW